MAATATPQAPISPATISGIIIDGLGGPVIAAKLTLQGAQTSLYVGKSSERGTFRFARIQPGSYALAISQAGFCPLQLRDIPVKSGEQLALPPIQLPTAPEGQNCP